MQAKIQERIKFLSHVNLFMDIRDNHEAMEALAAILEERTFKPNAYILKEGEMGGELFFLCKGDAVVFKETADGELYRVANLHAKDYPSLGEGAILDKEPRSATIQAETECHCYVLSYTAFDEFGKKHPKWALPVLTRIARVVMGRLRKTNQDILLLYHALVEEIRG